VVLKVANNYNNRNIVLKLFKILGSSTLALALKIENFIVNVTFSVDLQTDMGWTTDILLFVVENCSLIPKMSCFVSLEVSSNHYRSNKGTNYERAICYQKKNHIFL
jgi:hypothetical protein